MDSFPKPMLNSPAESGSAAANAFYASVVRRISAWQEGTQMELTPEINPMLNTPSRRKVTWGGGGDSGWGSEKIARLEGSREANKIMRDQIYECVPVREILRQIALTPLDTLLGK